MLFCIDEEVFFSEKIPLYDPIRYQLVNLTPAIQSLDWLIFYVRALVNQPFFESKSARVARTSCTQPKPGKLNRGLSQCEHTCGHGNSGSASRCGRRRGGGLATFDHFLESEKVGTETVLCQEKTTVLTTDDANVIIWVDMKCEKWFNWGWRVTFPALLMTPSHHSLEN